jgi:hypothetical protein
VQDSQLFDAVAENGATVPALWRLEVANSLTVAVRRRRIDADFRPPIFISHSSQDKELVGRLVTALD